MARLEEASYTSEQAAALGIEIPRQSWGERLRERIAGTVNRFIKYGAFGGAIGLVGGRLVGEGMIYLSNVYSPGSVSEGLVDFLRVGLPLYQGLFVSSGLGLVTAINYAILGEGF